MRRVIAEQYAKLPLPANSTACSGKTYIVTGSNNGLGLETARHLVRCSASRVILAVRNTNAGEAAKMDIERTTGHKGVTEAWHLDLSSFDSVKSFASRVEKELERVDGVIENAGVLLDTWTLAEGMETCMTVNVISTVLLGVLLMPKLMESAEKFDNKPRLVFLVSALGFTSQAQKELAKGGKTSIFKGLNNPKEQSMDQRYSLTKLVEMYAVRAFADAYPFKRTGVVINMVAPGICSTGLAKDARLFVRAMQGMIRMFLARTAEEGSRTILHAVVEDESSHGKHLSGCKVKEFWIASWMTDAEGKRTQKQIWRELVAVMEGVQPGCNLDAI
ncbi:NAD(P)-binding protein [Lentithecium fluviatile CBS 122367]|uniref:NAD(P)-binding protein n=1 Tax=Lentithecium fluviatile CBS 122367 TaxID=1168545 RepID=A0A6G1JL49_9PLEO|nr:NAD(P)-binding protein [Lentithecium fluviatile CBS 122367]